MSSEILPQKTYCKTNSVGRQHCQEEKKNSNLRVKSELNSTYFYGFSLLIENTHLCHIWEGNNLTAFGGEELKNEVNIAFPELHALNTSVWNKYRVPIARERSVTSFENTFLS